jgi:hypothetical protein
VNREIFLATLEQRFRSPVRIGLACAIVLFTSLQILLTHQVASLSHGGMLALVFAAGILGQEFSSGTPQLTFARPVLRWVWVLSRGGAVAVLAVAFALLPYLVTLLMRLPGADIGAGALESTLQAVAVSALMLGLSSIAPGLADLALLAGANLGLGILAILAQVSRDPEGKRVFEALGAYLAPWIMPRLDIVPLLHGESFSPHAMFKLASTIVFWVVVAMVMVNRKELTYATD